MFIEKQKRGKKIKYYLSHSYRESNKVKKIRRYLGSNLSKNELKKLEIRAKELILEQIREQRTQLFGFSLSKSQLKKLNSLDQKIHVVHLNKKNWKRFTDEFVYNTNAIEGSSVMLDEVEEILEKKHAVDSDEIETKGVAKAVDYIRNTNDELSLGFIKKLHKLCFKGSKSFAGKFREVDVVVRDSSGNVIHRGVEVEVLHSELEEMVKWYKKNQNKFRPLVLATIMHNQFEFIHPFQDGNGRVGRLLLNFVLIKKRYPPINILYRERRRYYQCLQDYSKKNKILPMLRFLISQYHKFLDDYKK